MVWMDPENPIKPTQKTLKSGFNW